MEQKFARQISAEYEVALEKDQRLLLWNELPLKIVTMPTLHLSLLFIFDQLFRIIMSKHLIIQTVCSESKLGCHSNC